MIGPQSLVVFSVYSTFYHGGATAQTLDREEVGNISYLCRHNFIDLLLSGFEFEPTSFRFEIGKVKF